MADGKRGFGERIEAFFYAHAPKLVQQWVDKREYNREAKENHRRGEGGGALTSKGDGAEPARPWLNGPGAFKIFEQMLETAATERRRVGQPDFFDNSIMPLRGDNVERSTHKPTQTSSYQAEQAYFAKHYRDNVPKSPDPAARTETYQRDLSEISKFFHNRDTGRDKGIDR